MAGWDKAPPTNKELKSLMSKPKAVSWDAEPPKDIELKALTIKPKQEPGALEQFGRNTVNALPAIGGIIGGAAGTPLDAVLGPFGTVAGAGLGATAGASLKNVINSYIDPEQAPKTNTEAITNPIEEGMMNAAFQGAGNIVAKGISAAAPYVKSGIKSGATKLASAISGESEKVIETYAKNTDDVNKIIKSSGGDMTAAADNVRSELSAGIQKAKNAINNKISKTLEASGNTARIDETPILNALNTAKSKLNPNFDASAIAEIDDMVSTIMAEAKTGRSDGGLTADGLYRAKKFLNDAAKSSYTKDGQIFSRSDAASRAAKYASDQARNAIKESVPEIAQADKELSRLYQIESRMNKNLLAPGKPDAALFAAGEGNNLRNAATLRELEKVSGVPVMKRIEQLASARSFASPSLIPSGTTGKVAARMGAGALVGGLMDGPEGALIGGALASPLTLKYGINAMNQASKISNMFPSFTGFVKQNPVAGQAVIRLLAGEIKDFAEIPQEAIQYIQQNPELVAQKEEPQLKGEALWMQKGADKLGLIVENPTKAQRTLLMEASDLPENSKRLPIIKSKLMSKGDK